MQWQVQSRSAMLPMSNGSIVTFVMCFYSTILDAGVLLSNPVGDPTECWLSSPEVAWRHLSSLSDKAGKTFPVWFAFTCLVWARAAGVFLSSILSIWTKSRQGGGELLAPLSSRVDSLVNFQMLSLHYWRMQKVLKTQLYGQNHFLFWPCSSAFNIAWHIQDEQAGFPPSPSLSHHSWKKNFTSAISTH